MNTSQTVSIEDVRRVADLANLELAADEETRMVRDLNAILGYVAQLNELDTSTIAPMAQVSEAIEGRQTETVLRADEVRPCLDRASVMASAPDTDGIFFKVPKVIER